MVEMMITVVIVAVCLVMALRVFSVCAKAVGESYNSLYAVKALDCVMNELREKAITEEGVEIGSSREEFEYDGRVFTVAQEITEWVSPTVEKLLEQGDLEVYGGMAGAVPDIAVSSMVEVELTAEWGHGSRTGKLSVKTLLPGKKYDMQTEIGI